MNSSEQPSQHIQPVRGKWRQRKGVALILVVSFIVLLSALVVGFFSRVTTDLAGARSYAEGISARQLAESAVSVVMGQIRAATTITNGCWASQPGMIRVYGGDKGVADSQAYRFYKLYSSHNMVVTDFSTFSPTDTKPSSGGNAEVPIGTGGWSAQPAFFTDLNEYAAVPDPNDPAKTVKRYPIFDPSVARIKALGQNIAANSANWVEGCEVSITDAQTLALNNAPMPVRWIYVLRDGTLTAPTPLGGLAAGNTGLKAIWNNLGSPDRTPSTGVPSKANPIVGRIAFWADDDTSKVNLNTAGGYVADESVTPNYKTPNKSLNETNPAFIAGSFWDTPRVQTYFDRGVSGYPENVPVNPHFRGGLASSQPVRNEYQRYPGHPSTTSLGLVLKGLMPAGSGLTSEKLYDFTPRLMSGVWKPGETVPTGSVSKNSQGGSRQLISYDMQLDTTVQALDPDAPCPVKRTYDPSVTYNPGKPSTWSYHLLGSVDEMYYTTLNIPTVTTANNARTPADNELNLKNAITPELIDKARFFLTAHNRSPELNLFGRPRVSIWPIPTHESQGQLLTTLDTSVTPPKIGIRNPSDDLFQFFSTVGEDPKADKDGLIRRGQFIFDREDPFSSTHDLTDPRRPRNLQIFKYLQEVTSNTKGRIPGWGQSFEGKYSVASVGSPSGGRDQILAEIFDYIRTVNLKDTTRDQRIDKVFNRVAPAPYSSTQQKASADSLKAFSRYAKRGIVVPTKFTSNGNTVSGFGRFPTVSEVSLVFYCGGYLYKDLDKNGKPVGATKVEYDYKKVDERNSQPGNATELFFNGKPGDLANPPHKLTGKLVRAFLIIETFNPMQGYGPVTAFGGTERIVYEMTTPPPFTIKTPSMTGAQSLNLGTGQNNVNLSSGNTWAGRNFGGTEGFFHTLQYKTSLSPTNNSPINNYYPFQTPCANPTDGIQVGIEDTEFEFTGGVMTLNIRYVDAKHNVPVQSLVLTWPNGQAWPVPITEREAGRWKNYMKSDWKTKLLADYPGYSGEGFRQVSGGFDGGTQYPLVPPPPGFNATDPDASNAKYPNEQLIVPGMYNKAFFLPLRIDWSTRNSNSPWSKFDKNGNIVGNGKNYSQRFMQIVQPGDTIRSLQAGDATLRESTDPRTTLLQAKAVNFKPHPDYNKQDANPNAKRRAQTLRCADGQFYFNPTDKVWFPGEEANPTTGMLAQLPSKTRYISGSAPDLPKTVVAMQKNGKAADFDTGLGNFADGGFCGKADEGNIARSWQDEWKNWHFVEPYFSTWVYDSPGDTYFSPNRQIPSPIMFGSLLAPNTTLDKAGWKTLLFCPNPAAGYTKNEHHGFASPPDHLLLDLFNMPVVEPYAISEPFSTEGKVNLNYQMMPFGYIERSTALRAALHPLRVTAIPTNFTRSNGGATELKYKGVANDENLRYLVDRDETLKGFDAFYKQFGPGKTGAGFFKSASQICEMFLYPKGQPINYGTIAWKSGDTDIKKWWNECSITGDNVREKPYSDLYSRVTTKSNTYTVHYRVQSLRQRSFTGTAKAEDAYYSTWDESRDQVMSEYRGHTTIERYLDPRDSRFDTNPNGTPQNTPNPSKFYVDKESLEGAYRFRVIFNKRFSPW